MRRNTSGFTLIEVLVALAILAIALVALIKISGQSVNSTARLKEKIAAHQVAMNVLAEAQVGLIDLRTVKQQEGVSNVLRLVWRWHAKVLHRQEGAYERVQVRVSPIHSDEGIEVLNGFVRLERQKPYE